MGPLSRKRALYNFRRGPTGPSLANSWNKHRFYRTTATWRIQSLRHKSQDKLYGVTAPLDMLYRPPCTHENRPVRSKGQLQSSDVQKRFFQILSALSPRLVFVHTSKKNLLPSKKFNIRSLFRKGRNSWLFVMFRQVILPQAKIVVHIIWNVQELLRVSDVFRC